MTFLSETILSGALGLSLLLLTAALIGTVIFLLFKLKEKAFLNDALASSSEGLAVWDANDCLVLCNNRYRELYPEVAELIVPGVSFETLLRKAKERQIYSPNDDNGEEFILRRLQRHRNPSAPFLQQLADGRWIQITERRTNYGGTIAVWTDVTELKRQEQELLHAQKMEAMGRLTGGVAHDFNNFLSVILGNLEVLQGKLANDEHALDLAQRSHSAAKRGEALVQRLLAFSRKQVLHPVVCDGSEVIKEMEDLLAHSVGKKIETKFSLAPESWPIKVDITQLESAILNIALNARDAMPNGGTLTIKTRNLNIGKAENSWEQEIAPGEYFELSIRDTGVGIPREIHRRLFEPFFTTKKAGQGTGLGLSMVYGFVKQSGGHLVVESELGKGAAVRMLFPKTTEAIDPGSEANLGGTLQHSPRALPANS